MALNIRNEETESLARELAQLTGETKTEAVKAALRERLSKLRRRQSARSLLDELDALALHCASLPVVDERTDDEILGYDENGLSR